MYSVSAFKTVKYNHENKLVLRANENFKIKITTVTSYYVTYGNSTIKMYYNYFLEQ